MNTLFPSHESRKLGHEIQLNKVILSEEFHDVISKTITSCRIK